MPVIAEIQDKYPQGNVLVVSHKATIRIMLCSLLGIDFFSLPSYLNTSQFFWNQQLWGCSYYQTNDYNELI
jgi:broad specificity phosphatase PhoE